MWETLRKHLQLKCYSFKILQQLKPDSNVKCATFCPEIMEKFSVNDVFSDEAMIHVSGTVINHSMQIWDLENPRDIIECVKDSPKINVSCALSLKKVYGALLFHRTDHYRHSTP
jgi:hypothetical protein